MNPNEDLITIRELAGKALCGEDLQDWEVRKLASAIMDLDNWLTLKGELPHDWESSAPRKKPKTYG